MYYQKRDFPGGLVVRLHAPHTGGMGLVPDQGIKIPHATLHGQKKKKKIGKKF